MGRNQKRVIGDVSESEKDAVKIKEAMENTVELKVPLKVDMEIGPSWGEIKKG